MSYDSFKKRMFDLAIKQGYWDIIKWAESVAIELHKGYFREDGVTPYIEHPEEVARLVRRATGGDSILVSVAWLHDVLEDIDRDILRKIIKENPDKYYILTALQDWLDELNTSTDDIRNKIKTLGKSACMVLAMLTLSPDVLVVKLCDMLANTEEGIKSGGTSQLNRYKLAAETLLKCQRTDCSKRHYKLARAIVQATETNRNQ
jgi:(p)ppGpp synthase/HD superfamily hydrolase